MPHSLLPKSRNQQDVLPLGSNNDNNEYPTAGVWKLTGCPTVGGSGNWFGALSTSFLERDEILQVPQDSGYPSGQVTCGMGYPKTWH